eukprot:TRINITY_DN11456_c1_g2_i2.p1 TRINITY_DN11456_c1_g2~~TRINITY_DN11456_c1_g2_i2.p1  ORF type:complete len:702 (+),score=201.68 TRINITY_DN11456_c1_g2_i2:88-2193(+)
MYPVKVFLNDDCRRFKVERVQEIIPRACALFGLDVDSFFEKYRVAITHGSTGINLVPVPNDKELRTIVDMVELDHRSKPIVLRVAQKSVCEAASAPQTRAHVVNVDQAVAAALKEAHVAALAQVDEAKAAIVTTKEANQQALQQAREQARERMQAAKDRLLRAKELAGKTGQALKTLRGKRVAKDVPNDKDTKCDKTDIKRTTNTENDTSEPKVSGRTAEPVSVDQLLTVGNVVTLTPAGMASRVRVTREGKLEARGGNGPLVQMTVMAREGQRIKLARHGQFLRVTETGIDGLGRDFAVAWLNVIFNADNTVSLTTEEDATVRYVAVAKEDKRVEMIDDKTKTEFEIKHNVAIFESGRGRPGRARKDGGARLRGKHGIHRLVCSLNPGAVAALKDGHHLPQPGQAEPEHGSSRDMSHDHHARKHGCGHGRRWGKRHGSIANESLTVEQRLARVQASCERLALKKKELEQHGNSPRLAHLSARLQDMQQRLERLQQQQAERAVKLQSDMEATNDKTIEKPDDETVLVGKGASVVGPSAWKGNDNDDTDDSDDWVQVEPEDETAPRIAAGDKLRLKSVATGDYLTMDAETHAVGLDGQGHVLKAIVGWKEGTVRLHSDTVGKAFLRVLPGDKVTAKVDMGGSGGKWTLLKPLINEDNTVSLASVQRPGYLIVADNDGCRAQRLASTDHVVDNAKFVICADGD